MIYQCRDERRRDAVSALSEIGINGIDFLDVVDSHTLNVYFINLLKPGALDKEHVLVEGEEGIWDVAVVSVNATGERVLTVKLNTQIRGAGKRLPSLFDSIPSPAGTYTLRLKPDARRLKLDPQLTAVSFTFTPPGNFDCQVQPLTLPAVAPTPVIDYLVKDYTSFRKLMLDRLSALLPDWQQQSEADLGVMLVEILAYAGDHLSYQQDVIATESYLSTARRRISVRRHARLLAYPISEGCNARVWVQVQVNQDIEKPPNETQPAHTSQKDRAVALPKGTKLITRVFREQNVYVTEDWAWQQMQHAQAEVFETMYDIDGLFEDLNELYFYTWGARECYIPKDSTSATLYGPCKHLQVGDVLIFKETKGVRSGLPEDADPTHRQAVRLTKITRETDPLGAWFPVAGGKAFLEEEAALSHEEASRDTHKHKNAGSDYSLEVTRIEWHYQDALLFPLCISGMIGDGSECLYCEQMSVALGNVVLADHGCTFDKDQFAMIPQNDVPASSDIAVTFPRFSPCLTYSPLTHVAVAGRSYRVFVRGVPTAIDASAVATINRARHLRARDATRSASEAGQLVTGDSTPPMSLPDITLNSHQEGRGRVPTTWHPQPDLLVSKPTDRHFVVEIDDHGKAYLRFGDNQYGSRPPAGTEFSATYRVGNGVSGNVGRESLYHIGLTDHRITKVVNPMPASGGIDPQSIDDVRQLISQTFSTQERGVRPEDYKEIAEREPEVERANAILRWTGSRYTAFLTVERSGGAPVDDAFRMKLRERMEPFRMAGADLVIVAPVYVSLEIEMQVQIQATYIGAKVKAALKEVFSNRWWPDGQQGIFYEGSYTFGTPVYLSDLYTAAYEVAGVQAVNITTFQRQDISISSGLEDGVLIMDWLEIARMENNPDAPSHGVFGLTTHGGVI